MAVVLLVHGQIQIPEEIRVEVGLMARDPLTFHVRGKEVVVSRVKPHPSQVAARGRLAHISRLPLTNHITRKQPQAAEDGPRPSDYQTE